MKGMKFNPKKREPREQREPDLRSTSGARRYLNQVQRGGTPEQISEAESKVAEIHPDMLLNRNRS